MGDLETKAILVTNQKDRTLWVIGCHPFQNLAIRISKWIQIFRRRKCQPWHWFRPKMPPQKYIVPGWQNLHKAMKLLRRKLRRGRKENRKRKGGREEGRKGEETGLYFAPLLHLWTTFMFWSELFYSSIRFFNLNYNMKKSRKKRAERKRGKRDKH